MQLSYWERINEKVVELFTLRKHKMISENEFDELRLNISKGMK